MVDRPIGRALDPKHNSLNFLRLLLALGVVYSHACELGWLGYRNIVIHGTSPRTISVYGFFGISGYLIAGSATKEWIRPISLATISSDFACLLDLFARYRLCDSPNCVAVARTSAVPSWVLYQSPSRSVQLRVLKRLSQDQSAMGHPKGPRGRHEHFSLWTLLYQVPWATSSSGLAAAGFSLVVASAPAAVTLILAGILATTTLDHRLNGIVHGDGEHHPNAVHGAFHYLHGWQSYLPLSRPIA